MKNRNIALVVLAVVASGVAVPLVLSLGRPAITDGVPLDSISQSNKLMADLKKGQNVKIRTLVQFINGSQEKVGSVGIDSLGPIHEKHRSHLRQKYSRTARAAGTRTNKLTGNEQASVRAQANALWSTEISRAIIQSLDEGLAFYTTVQAPPRVDGWHFVTSFGKKVMCDVKTGKVCDAPTDLKEKSRLVKEGVLKERTVNILIPIELSRASGFVKAKEYLGERERWAGGEVIREFNSKTYAERRAICERAEEAERQMVALDKLQKGRRPTRKERKVRFELRKIQAARPYGEINTRTYLASPPRRR